MDRLQGPTDHPCAAGPVSKGSGVHVHCVVSSRGLNAWAVQRGLARLGLQLSTDDHRPGVAEIPLLGRNVQQSGLEEPLLLFCTDEQTLANGWARSDRRVLPARLPFALDDKLAFVEFVDACGAECVPATPAVEPPRQFPVVLKARNSWRDGRTMPRALRCDSLQQWEEVLQDFGSRGWNRTDFISQPLIDGRGNNLSVCGFFDAEDPSRRALLVLQRVMPTSDRFGTGAAVRTVTGRPDLIEKTVDLLQEIGFHGPFELEFLRDDVTGKDLILEFNPRFWMQHGIFVDAFENWVIRLYRGDNGPSDWFRLAERRVLWFSGLELARWIVHFRWGRLVRGLLESVQNRMAGGRLIIQPGLCESVGLLWRAWRRRRSKT